MVCNHTSSPSPIPSLLLNDWSYFVVMLIFGLSNGYLGTLCMIYGPAWVQSFDEQCVSYLIIQLENFAMAPTSQKKRLRKYWYIQMLKFFFFFAQMNVIPPQECVQPPWCREGWQYHGSVPRDGFAGRRAALLWLWFSLHVRTPLLLYSLLLTIAPSP